MDIFSYRVKKYIGAYAVAMGGVDAVIFTAGLGENSPVIRKNICSGLEFLGAHLDTEKNNLRGEIREIGSYGDAVKLLVIPTNEEMVIAEETARLCANVVTL